jgi:hypothetical protein
MKTVVTCKIVKKGLLDPLMRKVATKIAEECTSTDGFKTKLTQIKEFNQRAKPQPQHHHAHGASYTGATKPTGPTQSSTVGNKHITMPNVPNNKEQTQGTTYHTDEEEQDEGF